MQIARSKPNAVSPAAVRPLSPPSCERAPSAGFFPEKTPVYRVVLGCSFSLPHAHEPVRTAGR